MTLNKKKKKRKSNHIRYTTICLFKDVRCSESKASYSFLSQKHQKQRPTCTEGSFQLENFTILHIVSTIGYALLPAMNNKELSFSLVRKGS